LNPQLEREERKAMIPCNTASGLMQWGSVILGRHAVGLLLELAVTFP